MSSELPPYLFRGTTLGFPGNRNSQYQPVTCTTRHPVKAAQFAQACRYQTSYTPVIYLAKSAKLADRVIPSNVLNELEDEVALNMAPLDFSNYCEGFVTLEELETILHSQGISWARPRSLHDLSEKLDETPPLTASEFEALVNALLSAARTL